MHILVISSYGKLSGLAAMIWTGDFYLWLPLLLVLPSQFQAIRGERGEEAGEGKRERGGEGKRE